MALPPDPEGKNDTRAGWGEQVILRFEALTGCDREDALADMLCDLMHWCDRNGLDFARQVERAEYHYQCETSNEP